MASIGHVKTSYYDWFHTPEDLKSNLDKIRFVGKQETFDEDYVRFKEIFGIPDYVTLPKDDVKSHKNPEYFDKRLNEVATKNLKQYYKSEYEFLDILVEEGFIDRKYS